MSPHSAVKTSFEDRVAFLRLQLQGSESALVAFSGGVDSALLAFLAHDLLKERMKALLGVSPSVPERDRQLARAFCAEHGIPFAEIATDEFTDPNYLSNPENRCFYCKNSLYKTLCSLAAEQGYKAILDGTNASDLVDHRPGRLAAAEHGIRSPFIEAHFSKEDIRRLARELKLTIAEKPASACLASRIPTHTPIEPRMLSRIDRAENALRDLGLAQVRVRHHGDVARIEVGSGELPAAFALRERIAEALLLLGWRFVTLDLAGYRPPASRIVAL